ncbi:type II toxin-antitoxin system Phd/YefM family antitoxin [Kribbella sp. NPDC049227]|uniref:type II toxin-antitoxin system Phd/YefM family antitoxin n=1 Tax=Kribbella sp. NPDC049227 TaxID=3364113 RepID=UPI003720A0BF
MSHREEITQRDLRMRSREIMDAVEGGQVFVVTRDGHRIGELLPLRRRRRFVPRAEFDTNIMILRRSIDPAELPSGPGGRTSCSGRRTSSTRFPSTSKQPDLWTILLTIVAVTRPDDARGL